MKPIKGMKEQPALIYEPIMIGAFVGCVRWALGDDKIRKSFEKETGLTFSFLHNRNPIDAMIDKASGREAEIFAKFADWVVVNIWGREDDIGHTDEVDK